MAKIRSPDTKARIRTKFAEYVGSFTVEDQDLEGMTWRIHQQLHFLKKFPRKMAVILKFSSQGIKMFNENKEILLMAHALKRILYTTCQPLDCQFAFVTRNPCRPPTELFCHLFVTAQPNEAAILNLQLCRMFQVACCMKYKKEQQSSPPVINCSTRETPVKPGSPVLSTKLVKERYGDLEVSLNVSALVTFRRISEEEIRATEVKKQNDQDTEETFKSENYGYCTSSPNVPSSGTKAQAKELDPLEDCPFSSLTLVRKKAIRNKGIRSGAYRSSTFKRQFQEALSDGYSCRWGDDLLESWRALAPLQHEEVLMDTVWASAGIPRDCALELLKRDVLGAFLLWANSGLLKCWTLMMRTPFGVINYVICANDEGKCYLEHLNTQFPSIKALIEHYTTMEDGLFCCLSASRLNHCYEEQDSAVCDDLYAAPTKPEDRLLQIRK
ncbi:SH2 domain-containing protein 5 isoform X1 [Leucoraja erinacea]|uniref:SH2 domain-containing protein 5 isoform X1 n=2 Tax=Leucoraja erinaceus TaxID=7782 RepID=UPI002453B0E6|nr:SH2 domain-containing protein 5 isoform X1 [Leucoraja erinacea]